MARKGANLRKPPFEPKVPRLPPPRRVFPRQISPPPRRLLTSGHNNCSNGFGSQPRNKETRVPAMLFEVFPKLRGQHAFFFPRLYPKTQDDQANSHDASPLVNRQSSTDRGQIDSGINGMSKASVGPSANELVVLFESDSSAPKLSQVPAGPQSDSDADPGEYYARNSKSVCSMENAMTKNADLRCVAEEQGKATNFQKKDAVT